MGKKYLSYEDVLNIIKDLARSKGQYGRLYRDLMENEDSREYLKEVCEKEKFKQDLDFILWFEC